MAIQPMAIGGRWMRPPHDAPPVYVPAKQVEAHYTRLVGEKWMPIDDPRTDDGYPIASSEPAMTLREVAMQGQLVAQQTQIDQLTSLVQQLLAQKEQPDGSTLNNDGPDNKDAAHDRRSSRNKSAV